MHILETSWKDDPHRTDGLAQNCRATIIHCRTGHRGLKSTTEELGDSELSSWECLTVQSEPLQDLVTLRPVCGPPIHRVAAVGSLQTQTQNCSTSSPTRTLAVDPLSLLTLTVTNCHRTKVKEAEIHDCQPRIKDRKSSLSNSSTKHCIKSGTKFHPSPANLSPSKTYFAAKGSPSYSPVGSLSGTPRSQCAANAVLMNSPRHDATHQHYNTSAEPAEPANNQETNNNHSNKHQHRHQQHHNNNHLQPTTNARLQEQ